MISSHLVVRLNPPTYPTDACVTAPFKKACLVSTSEGFIDLEIVYLNLCNVLAWHHNKPKEAACHVHLQGRFRRCFCRCFGCGLYSAWSGWAVLVGLGQYDIAFLKLISYWSGSSDRMTYVIGALEVPVEHSRISNIDLELLV